MVLLHAGCGGGEPTISVPSAGERLGLVAWSEQHAWVQRTPRMTLEMVFGVGSDSELGAAEGRARAAAAAAIRVDVREETSDKETAWIAQGEQTGDHTQTEIQSAVDSFVVRRLNVCGAADLDGNGQISPQEPEDGLAPRVARAAQRDGRSRNPSLVVGPCARQRGGRDPRVGLFQQ